MLAVGTLLYLNEFVGAGVIFAASVLTARAIYPVDSIASSWRQFWNFRAVDVAIELLLQEEAKLPDKVPPGSAYRAARGLSAVCGAAQSQRSGPY